MMRTVSTTEEGSMLIEAGSGQKRTRLIPPPPFVRAASDHHLIPSAGVGILSST